VKIEILGVGCPRCKALYKNVEQAVKELNIDTDIIEVTDIDKIGAYNVIMTPGLAINGKLLSCGKLLMPQEIKKLIKGS